MECSKPLLRATLVAALGLCVAHAAPVPDQCRDGYVWREAFASDHVCVTPQTRAQAAQDNSQAAARRQPGGGAYGPNTCIPGYVWREARAGDFVCVVPQTRTQAAGDNAQAAARRVDSTPSGASSHAAGYTLSEWSAWSRTAGIEYRYRWGSDPQQPRYAGRVDAVFQMRNPLSKPWEGAARSLDCAQDTLAMSKRVVLKPNETREVTFLTPNCGSRQRPSFRANVVRSTRID